MDNVEIAYHDYLLLGVLFAEEGEERRVPFIRTVVEAHEALPAVGDVHVDNEALLVPAIKGDR
jgi:hypothetical protein